MNLVQVPHPEEEEKEWKKEEEGGGVQKAAATLRLLTLAAAISAAKGEEGEKNQEESNLEFKVMMVIFTLAIVFITCMGQHLWKVGVRRVRRFLRSQAGSSSRSLPAGAGEREEGEEKKEGGGGRAAVTDVRRPMYLLAGGVEPAAVAAEQPPAPNQGGDGTAAETQFQRPKYLPPGEVEPVPGQASAQPPCLVPCNASPGQIISSSSEDTPYRPLDERHMSGFDIDRAVQEIAEEERNLYEEAQRNPERFQNHVNSEDRAAATFQVLTTRYSRVYHYQSRCRYLLSPQTGAILVPNLPFHRCSHTWASAPRCHILCIDHWGGDYHVDPRCPRCDPEKAFPACQGCGESAG